MLRPEELGKYRARLYVLQGESEWLDQGIGMPYLAHENDKDFLKFSLEEGGTLVYQVELTPDLQFDQQEDKIFTWYNEKTNTDMALSFQEQSELKRVRINEILAKKRFVFAPWNATEEEVISQESDDDRIFDEIPLNPPNENNLQKFENDLSSLCSGNSERKNLICQMFCIRRAYLDSLIKIFRKAESEQDEDKIYIIFKIVRFLTHYDLYTVLFSDEYYMDIFGILEYDPEIRGKLKVSHRQYFKEHASFKQVANIKDETVIRGIHWNFRLIYLRDSVIAHVLDERILQYLSAIIHTNYVDILKYIQSSREALSSIFEALRVRKLNALKMIHEMSLIMKNLEIDRIAVFEIFNEFNMFETLEEIMINTKTPAAAFGTKMPKKDTKKKEGSDTEIDLSKHYYLILEVLMLSLVQAPHVLRDYCISQQQKILKYPFLTHIIEKTTSHEDPMIQNMLGEVIKHLIDTSEIGEDNPITKLFYDQFLARLIKIFDDESNEDRVKNAKNVVLDLIMYCLKQQGQHMKEYIIPLDLVQRAFKIFKIGDKFLIIPVIQFYKMLLHIKDPDIINNLVNPIDTLVDFFINFSKNKKNLIHSAILELFVVMINEELTPLLEHIVENHKGFLEQPYMQGIAQKIKQKHAKLTTGEDTSIQEEKKTNESPFLSAARRGRPNLTIISPFGSVLTADTTEKMKPSLSQPSTPSNGSATGMKRTSSNLAKIVDYDDEMEFNLETRGKDNNFMLEDIQLKKRKLDEMNNNIKILHKENST